MELAGYLRLAFTGGSPRKNPLSRLIWRGQRRASQTGMLVAAVLFISAVTFAGKVHLRVRGEFLAYLFLRWGLAEFFWIWMSADHVFSTVTRWKKRRAFDDLRLTSLTPWEMAVGFLGPAIAFLLIGDTVHCVLDALTPYGRGVGFRSYSGLLPGAFSDLFVWRFGLSAGFWFSAFATIAVTTTWSFRVALVTRRGLIHARWFETLVQSGLMIGVIDFISILIGLMVSSVVSMAMEVVGGGVRGHEAPLVGGALVIATFTSGFLKTMTLSRREWVAAVDSVKQYIEPEDRDAVEAASFGRNT